MQSIVKATRKIRCAGKTTWYKLAYGRGLTIEGKLTFRAGFNITFQDSESASLIIGDGCFFNNYCSINCLERIEIGRNCLFGEGVKIYDHDHLFDSAGISKSKFVSKPVFIGDGCWLGSNVTILKGVSIGRNCIIAAGTTLTKSVTDNTIVHCSNNIVCRPR